MAQFNGIDVSHWNDVVSFEKVKDSGIDFVILKAGGSDNGFYEDRKFEDYYYEAKVQGLNVGCYYYVGKNCKGAENGAADGKRFVDLVKDRMIFEYPLFLDFEAPDTSDPKANTDAAIAFCDVLEQNGFYASIYASDISGFKERLQLDRLKRFDKWVARYGKSPEYVDKFGIWQYSSKGTVPGINGNVDMDISYINYPAIMIRAKLNGF